MELYECFRRSGIDRNKDSCARKNALSDRDLLDSPILFRETAKDRFCYFFFPPIVIVAVDRCDAHIIAIV